ncbi:MAG TPA: lysophospholipid acyltransferase family protein [Urbifossiella sp.]|nr:lysophospholipid acyltransferase family protein [Urbifossiella sp.]
MSDRPGLIGRRWYDFANLVAFPFYFFGFSYRYSGRANVPRRGPVLLVSNHQSMLDPVLIGACTNRYLTFLARSTLFSVPVIGPLIHSLNAIPIDRNMGKDGIQSVLERLSLGQAVLMFPEGERTHTGEVQPLKPGVSLLIKRVMCPIVPVGIAGCFAAWNRFMKWPRWSPPILAPGPSTIGVAIGKPIDPRRYQGVDRAAMLDDLRMEIAQQKETAERLRRK